MPRGSVRKAEVIEQLRDRLPFLDYAPVCFTSATRGEGVDDLFASIDGVAAAARRRVPAGEVTTVMQQAIERRPDLGARRRRSRCSRRPQVA